jgi:hypothetical protein
MVGKEELFLITQGIYQFKAVANRYNRLIWMIGSVESAGHVNYVEKSM